MRLDGEARLGHLTYCTNIHAGESWAEVREALRRHLPEVKATLAPAQPMGVGLRLSAAAARSLEDPAAFAELRGLLDGGGFYVFTINGFPYGAFHGERVKEGAYRPDWSDAARLRYTNALAELLAALLPDDMAGSISTVPGTFKPWAAGREQRIVDNIVGHVAHLVDVEQRTGKTIVLALEPEPCCLLETIAETVAFFENSLLARPAVERLAALTGLTTAAAQDALHRHLGVCYDVCHAAVEFEEPGASIAALRSAGIQIAKLQLSAALKIPRVEPATVEQLRPFDEPVYLHQVVARRPDGLTRYLDLNDAFADAQRAQGAEWRIHFHVPIFLGALERFSTTQDFLSEILTLHRNDPVCDQLEVETYTWDVLPEQHRNVGVGAAIARELSWVRDQLLT